MKLNKKFLAGFTAMTLAVAPMSVFAADGDRYEVSGEGTVTTLETEIYNVVLPTSESLKFNVDPYGLLNLTPGTTLEQAISKAAGTVTSSATAVVNKSSVGIDVGMELFFDQSSANVNNSSNSAIKLGSYADAKSGAADLYLSIEHISGAALEKVDLSGAAAVIPEPISNKAFEISTSALQFTSATTSTEVAAVVTATGNATSTSGTALNFSLKDVAYAYEVTKTAAGVYAAELSEKAVKYTPNNVYAFAITGYANPSSDKWLDISDAGGKLELIVKFSIKEAAGIQEVTTSDGSNEIVLLVGEISATTYTLKKGTKTSSGNLGTDFSYSDGVVTISSSVLTTLKGSSSWGTGSYSLTIGSSTYSFTIN